VSREIDAASELILLRVVGFAQLLREEGIQSGPDEQGRAAEMLAVVALTEQDGLYWAMRSAFLRRFEDLPTFDRAFELYWLGAAHIDAGWESLGWDKDDSPPQFGRGEPSTSISEVPAASANLFTEADDCDEDASPTSERATYSSRDVLTHKQFGDYDSDDYLRLARALTGLSEVGPWRRGRRHLPSWRGKLDMRSTLRTGLRTEGELLLQRRQRPRPLKRRLLFACDVSGSMESFSRAVLMLAHLALTRRHRVEAFVFATRLTRVTRELLSADPEQAFHAATGNVLDWSGGTRLGQCLDDLERRYRGVVQGAVVVVASDGWDLGDPDLMASAVKRISRRAYSLVWANPNLADPDFQPITRGMAAALPHVDHLVGCHDLGSLETLVRLLDRL
jgi:uncharacterized protein